MVRVPVLTAEEFTRYAAELDRRRGSSFVPHRPTPKQAEFLDLECVEAMYGGAAGGGKSDALLMAFFGNSKDPMAYVKQPKYSGLILRRTYADLSLPGAIMSRAQEWLQGSEAKWHDKDKTWTFPSGATLTFGYLEHENDKFRYQGAELQYVAFDELTQFTESQYTYLFSRLRRPTGSAVPIRMRSATNPGGIGHVWVHKRFVASSGQPALSGVRFVQAKLDDNPHVDRQSYKESLARLDEITRKQLEDGSWLRDESSLVYKYSPERNTFMALPPGEYMYVMGVDLGHDDAFAISVLAISLTRAEVYVVETFSESGLLPSQWRDKIQEFRRTYHPYAIVGDYGGLGKAIILEMKEKHAIPIEPAEKSGKASFIRLMNGDLQSGALKLRANSPVIEQMSALLWHPDFIGIKEHPDMANDLCDTVLYAWREARHHLHKGDAPPAPAYGTAEWHAAERDRMRQHAQRVIEKKSRSFEDQFYDYSGD